MRKVVSAVVVIGLLLSFGVMSAPVSAADEPLVVYCGAGLMKPMDELKAAFEEREDMPVRMIYAGSGELFGMIATRQEGDVYIPGAEKYTMDALEKGMVLEDGIETICYHVPVILVPGGNPAGIECLQDMAGEGVKVALADSKAAAIGKTADAILKKNNLTEAIEANVVTRPSTTNQLLIYTATGQVDAAIAWEDQATWGQAKGKVDIVRIPAEQNTIKTIPAAVVSFTGRADDANAFIQFITSEEGKTVWEKWGFPIEKPE